MSIRIGIGLDNFASAGIDANAQTIYNRIIADGGVSNLTRLNFFVKGLKAIYGDLANVPVCYDAHWIGYKLGSGTGATAGQAAAKLYSLTVAGDAVQTTAASQPLLLSHNGASSDNYFQGVGIANNFVSSPSATANSGTGDKEFIITANVLNWSIDYNMLIGKNTGGLNGYYVVTRSSSRIGYGCSKGDVVSTVGHSFANNTLAYIKVTHDTTNGIVKFFTSTDGITYNQLGTNVSITSGVTTDTSTPLCIGANSNGASNSFTGKVYRATISNSIGGAPVVDFNPAQYNASTSQTQWTSSTGEVWTINTGTADGYKGLLVDRTYIQGDGIDDVMIATGLASRQYYSSYAASRIQTFSGNVRGILGSVGQRNLIYVNTTGDVRAIAVGIAQYAGEVNNRFQLFTANFELLAGSVLTNNANKVTTALGGVANTTAYVLSDGTTGFGNFVFSTGIQSSATDSVATNTATYDFIRSLNNNAF